MPYPNFAALSSNITWARGSDSLTGLDSDAVGRYVLLCAFEFELATGGVGVFYFVLYSLNLISRSGCILCYRL